MVVIQEQLVCTFMHFFMHFQKVFFRINDMTWVVKLKIQSKNEFNHFEMLFIKQHLFKQIVPILKTCITSILKT